jgi:hypothetical protein
MSHRSHTRRLRYRAVRHLSKLSRKQAPCSVLGVAFPVGLLVFLAGVMVHAFLKNVELINLVSTVARRRFVPTRSLAQLNRKREEWVEVREVGASLRGVGWIYAK